MKFAWRAELLKITTVPGLWLGASLSALALPLLSLLVVATGGLGTEDTITSGAATASVVGLLAYGAWAATLSSGEYARQTMSVSLTIVPRRVLLYGSKLAAAAAVAGGGALVSAILAFGIVGLVTPSGEHDWGNPAALVSVVLAVVAVAVMATAVGVLARSSTAAIGIVLVAVLLPKAAAGLLGGLQPWIVGASPGTVITQIVGGAQLPTDQQFPPGAWAAAATMLAVAATVAVAGGIVFNRRDGG